MSVVDPIISSLCSSGLYIGFLLAVVKEKKITIKTKKTPHVCNFNILFNWGVTIAQHAYPLRLFLLSPLGLLSPPPAPRSIAFSCPCPLCSLPPQTPSLKTPPSLLPSLLPCSLSSPHPLSSPSVAFCSQPISSQCPDGDFLISLFLASRTLNVV